MIDIYYILAGCISGFIIGLTGVGGGALMTPVLLLVFNVSPINAIGTDLWFAAFTKLVGVRVHMRSNSIDWSIVKKLWIGSLPVAILVVLLIHLGSSISKLLWLTHTIGWMILVTAIFLIFGKFIIKQVLFLNMNSFQNSSLQSFFTILCGAILGLCVSLTSVGAGALGSVFLLSIYPKHMTAHRLVSTDLMHAIPLAFIAALGYFLIGHVDVVILLNLLIGSLPTVILGSFLAHKLPEKMLRYSIGIVLFCVGLKTLFA